MSGLLTNNQHAKLSPSSSKRWMTCPGSVRLIDQITVVDKTSKFASEGTAAHELHERCLKDGSMADQYLGDIIVADSMEFIVDDEMVESVEQSLDYVRDRTFCAEMNGESVITGVEVRSDLSHLKIPGLEGGTSDVVIVSRDSDHCIRSIEIIDYKHGQGVAVDAVNNSQLLCYASGVVDMYDADDNVCVRITISQPRAYHPEGRIRSWDITAGDVKRWQNDVLIPAAKATLDDNADLNPSDDGCRFCPAAASCPALYEQTQSIATSDFADLSSEDPVDVKLLTDEQKLYVMQKADVIRSFLKAVEAQVKHEVEQGSKSYKDDYKLVKKVVHRRLRDDAIYSLESQIFDHLSEGDVFEHKIKSVSKIEKLLKDKLGSKEAKRIMEESTYKPDAELTLAHVSDRRLAQKPSITSDFDEI